MNKRQYYLIELQFLGFRFHGWQKQTNSKTVQEMVDKTIRFIFPDIKFKTLGCGRTDSYVSANEFLFELFIYKDIDDLQNFLSILNENLPADMRALSVKQVDEKFNIINDPKTKEYMYLFSYGQKNHPFCAPFMVNISDNLDIELMKKGASLYVGEHNFKSYCYRPNPQTKFLRSIDKCEIVENDLYQANFFPDKTFIFHVHGKGFMRHQVRIMIGTLFSLGRGDITLDDIRASLRGEVDGILGFVAPSSGLMLNKISLD